METALPYLAPVFGIFTGIILLCMGARMLKPAIGLGAWILGAGCGFLLAPTMSLGVSPFIVAIVFGSVAAILAVYISKFAILVLIAVSFALVVPAITWQVAGLGNGTQVVRNVVEAASQEKLTPPPSEATSSFSAPELEVYTSINEMSLRVLAMVRAGKERILSAWNAIPTGPRFIVIGAAVAGLLMGLLIATFMPYFSAALVTAFGGSVLLRIGVGQITAELWGSDGLIAINSTVLFFSMIGVALAGLGLQLTYTRKNPTRKKSAE